jgi:CRP-like cAMP-binding protein
MPPWEHVLRGFVAQYLENSDSLVEALTSQQLHSLQMLKHGEVLCRRGESADCVWLIIDGAIDIYGTNGEPFRQRRNGELVGEQAFFLGRTPKAEEKGRSAEMRAHGHTTLLRFDGALADKLTLDQRYLWYEMLANVVNEKLVEATRQRSELTSKLHWHTDLVRKFGDASALGVVMLELTGGAPVKPEREVVVWFSDIAGFSAWSKDLGAVIV